MQIDIIGDIHGHADALEALLSKLGYARDGATWRHRRGRRVVFVGDLIDRGPRQLDTVSIVRAMVDAGAAFAVMGNHEFNAIGYATPDPAQPGAFLRAHVAKNLAQHHVFLEAVGGIGSQLHRELVAYFRTLPLWLDLGTVRIVHACWCPDSIEALAPHVDGASRLTETGLHAAHERGSQACEACEILLKGAEMDLPSGLSYRDSQGHERHVARTRWWDADATTFRAACVERSVADSLSDAPLPHSSVILLDSKSPVFFGHYWMTGKPRLLTPTRTCLDFSIAKGGVLCAYRFDGEQVLDSDKLVWVG